MIRTGPATLRDGFAGHFKQAGAEIARDTVVGYRALQPLVKHGLVESGVVGLSGVASSGVIVSQAASQNAGRFRIGGPFIHPLSIAEGREPFEQGNKAFALCPIPWPKVSRRYWRPDSGLLSAAVVSRIANIRWRRGDTANG